MLPNSALLTDVALATLGTTRQNAKPLGGRDARGSDARPGISLWYRRGYLSGIFALMWSLARLTAEVAKFRPTPCPTRWVVLTGQPSSGKSTVLRRLAAEGFATYPEVALDYILELRAQGHSLAEAVTDKHSFTEEIVRRGRRRVADLNPSQIAVLDRSLVDALAFALIDGLDVSHFLPRCLDHRFALTLVFDPVAQVSREDVYHDEPKLIAVGEACKAVYNAMGGPVLRVPLFSGDQRESVVERTRFVADQIRAFIPS